MATFQILVDDSFQRASTSYSAGATSNQWGQLGPNNWFVPDARFAKIGNAHAVFITGQTAEAYRTETVSLNAQVVVTLDSTWPSDPFVYISPRSVMATKDWIALRVRLSAGNLLLDGWRSVAGSRSQTGLSGSGTASIAYTAGHTYKITVQSAGTTSPQVIGFIQDVTASTTSGTITVTWTSGAPADLQAAAGCSLTVTGGTTDVPIARVQTYYDCANTLALSPTTVSPNLASVAFTTTCSANMGTLSLQLINSSAASIVTQTGSGTTTGTLNLIPGSATSGVVVQDSATSSAFYLNIAPVTISASPNSLAVSQVSAPVTITGQGTAWGSGTTPLSIISGPGTITSQTQADLGTINLTITTGASAGTIVIQDSTTGKQCSVGVVQVFAPDAVLAYMSEGNWLVTAGTSIQTNNAGAYLRIKTTSGSTLQLTFDMSTYTGAGLTQYPTVAWYSDNGGWTKLTLGAATTTVTIDSGLSPSSDHERFILVGDLPTGFGYNRWTSPIPIVRITQVITDGTPVAPTTRTNRMIFYGDSIVQGNIIGDSYGNSSTGGAHLSWVLPFADIMNAEVCIVGFSGQGWRLGGADGVPAFHVPNGARSWDKLDSAHSRSFTLTSGSGYYNDSYIFMGMNDFIQSAVVSDAQVTASVTDFLVQHRAAVGSRTRIRLIIEFGQPKRSAMLAGYAAYKAANSDSLVYLIDPPAISGIADQPYGTPSYRSADSTHPRQSDEVAYMTGQLAKLITAADTVGGGGGLAPLGSLSIVI